MRFRPALLGLTWLVLSGGMAWGQGPDTIYVRIYSVIQEADGLRERGQTAEAVARYSEAQRELLQFREQHPSWHQNVVNYRLNYVATRLQPLVETLSQTNKAAATAPAQQPPAESTPEDKLQTLQGEIEQLTAQNKLLQEKLKEAWTAQPTTTDPAELAKAHAQIKELEKERDLLQVTLDRRETTPASPADANILEQERRILQEVKKQLADEQARNKTLQQENETLQQQLADAKNIAPVAPLPDSDLAKQLTEASATLAELRATNRVLQTQLVFLRAQMAEMTKAAAEGSSPERVVALEGELKTTKTDLKEARRERDSLEKKLSAANRRLERRQQGEEIEELQKQLAEAESRLATMQAEAVPLTPEEAALVKGGPDIQAEVAQKGTASTAANQATQLPPGAGPLIAQARRAIEQGRLEEAEERLLEVLRQDENNVFTLATLAGVQLELRQPEEAEKYLNKALSLEPNDPGSLYLLGIVRYQQQNYDEALDALSRSAQLNPDKPETQYFLGLTLLQKGSRGPAETALRKAIQLRPGWSNAHYELAVVYATQKPPFKELAQWHYQKAIRSGSPRNADLEKLLESDAATPEAPSPQ